jgi:hypothetical protein
MELISMLLKRELDIAEIELVSWLSNSDLSLMIMELMNSENCSAPNENWGQIQEHKSKKEQERGRRIYFLTSSIEVKSF